jgi:spermidine synthase
MNTVTIVERSESGAQTTYTVRKPLVWAGSTAYQEVIIADSAEYGRMLFLDGELQSAAADERIYHECLVHPVMAAFAQAGGKETRVLVVGGGEGATVREVLRWSPAAVDWVDIDGELVELCERHLDWATGVRADPRVRFFAEDIRAALPRLCSGAPYDVIVLDLPDPDGETGWLYSAEFWAATRAAGRRIVTHCGPVRPWGDLGAGFQRIMAGLDGWRAEFYHVGMPSFQGEWGFVVACPVALGDHPLPAPPVGLPSGLRVVDDALLGSWVGAGRPRLWAQAVAAAGVRLTL